MIHHLLQTIRSFLPPSITALAAVFLIQLLALTWLERNYGLYRHAWRAVFWADLATTLYLFLIVVPLGDRLTSWMPATFLATARWSALSPPLRLLVYIVAADLGHYALHRLMHSRFFWRTHRWHHSIDHVGFLAGNRESLMDRLIAVTPYAFFSPLLYPAPPWVWTGLLVFAMLKNDWTHLNVTWGSHWAEWVIVTPRYHHMHHSTDQAHHDKNLAILFSVWDRLFGTFVDPEPHVGHLTFGIPEKVPAPRLILGI